MNITVKILRFDPEQDKKQHWENYALEVAPTDRVLDAPQSAAAVRLAQAMPRMPGFP